MGKHSVKTIFAIVFSIFLSITPSASATASVNLLEGQNHYYTVMMRSDEQSVVYARIVFENSSDKNNLKQISFSVPDKVKLENASVQQIMAKSDAQTCKTFETYDAWKQRNGYSASYLGSQYQYEQNRKCLEFAQNTTYDEDYNYNNNAASSSYMYDFSYYSKRDTKFEYFDLAPRVDGRKYSVNLTNEIKPKKQGAIIVSFSTKDYISGGVLGRYAYDFKSLQVSEMVNKSIVSINFDEELYSRLTASKRTTSESIQTSLDANKGSAAISDGYESRTIDDIQTNIGRGGRYEKEKSQLMPNQVFEVAGVFATNKTMLYIWQIVGWLVGLVGIAVMTYFIIRWYRRKHPVSQKTKTVQALADSPENVTEQATTTDIPSEVPVSLVRIIAVSFASVGVTLLIVLVAVVTQALLHDASYSFWSEAFVPIAASVISFFALFAMPLLYMLRYGYRATFLWAAAHLAVLVGVLVFAGLIIAVLLGSNSASPITPYM